MHRKQLKSQGAGRGVGSYMLSGELSLNNSHKVHFVDTILKRKKIVTKE